MSGWFGGTNERGETGGWDVSSGDLVAFFSNNFRREIQRERDQSKSARGTKEIKTLKIFRENKAGNSHIGLRHF